MPTPHPSWTDAGFVLANWEVRPRHGTLVRRDREACEPVRIEPRVMAVLSCLARHVGEVVTRDEFSAEVWGGRVVSDEALSRCISLLRHVLADDSREPRFIRTVARIGYTLVPTPTPLAGQAGQAGQPAPPLAPELAAAGTPLPPQVDWPALLRNRRLRRPVLVAVGCSSLVLVLLFLYSAYRVRPGAEGPPPPVTRLLVLPFDTGEAKGIDREVGVELADEITDSLAHVERLQIAGRRSADMLAAAHTGAVGPAESSASMPY